MNPLNSIKNIAGQVGNWAKTNIGTGDQDFTPSITADEYTPTHPEAKEIKKDLDKIENSVKDIQKDVSNMTDLSQLKPPSLADFSDKNLVIIGTSTGAAAGLAVGMANEVINAALDNPKVVITETEHVIKRPVMQGYEHTTSDIKDGDGYLQGTQHSFSPRIEYQEVGKYTEKTGEVVHTADAKSPVISGAKHMIAGAGIGLGVSVAVAVGRKILHKGEYVAPEEKERKLEGQGKVIAVTSAAGAVGGGLLAGLGGVLESGNTAAKEISYKAPVMEQVNLGQIPQDAKVSTYDVFKESNLPRRDVIMESPQMKDPLIGGEKPVLEKVTKTVEGNARFGTVSQVIGGTVLGAVGGALVGIMVNVLRKII